MAGIRKKGDAFYCTFRFQGRRYYFALGKLTEAQALARGAEVDETLDLIERGRLQVPDGVSLEDFVAAGGKAPAVAARPEKLGARQLFDRYLETHGNGTPEANSLATCRTYLKQVAVSLGDRFRIQRLTLQQFQEHIDRRQQTLGPDRV